MIINIVFDLKMHLLNSRFYVNFQFLNKKALAILHFLIDYHLYLNSSIIFIDVLSHLSFFSTIQRTDYGKTKIQEHFMKI